MRGGMKVAARIGEKLRREIERGRRRSAHSSVLYTLYLRNTLSMHPPFRRKPACLSPACLCVAFCRERTNAIVYQPLPIAPIVVVCRGEREIFSNTLKRGYRRVRSVSGRSAGAAHVSNSAGVFEFVDGPFQVSIPNNSNEMVRAVNVLCLPPVNEGTSLAFVG